MRKKHRSPFFGIVSINKYTKERTWLLNQDGKPYSYTRADAIEEAKMLNNNSSKPLIHTYYEAVPLRS